jgi:hypothetical protein
VREKTVSKSVLCGSNSKQRAEAAPTAPAPTKEIGNKEDQDFEIFKS